MYIAEREAVMDTNNLRYFAAVAQYGSISRAARAMFISQPQLSHIIKQMEKEMGLTLFRRTSQGTKLTADGQKILGHCRIILDELGRLEQMVTAQKVEVGSLSVSMTRFSHIAECFNTICRKYEDVDSFSSHLSEASTMDVIDQVKNGYSNVGVIHSLSDKTREEMEHDFSRQGLAYLSLGIFSPQVCLASDHELVRSSGRKGIHIEELQDYGLVRYNGQYEDFIYHFQTAAGSVDLNDTRKIVYVNDRQEQMKLLSCTNFYTIGIVEFRDQDALYNVISVPLLGCREKFRFGVITRQDVSLSRMEQEFIALLRQQCDKLQAENPPSAS